MKMFDNDRFRCIAAAALLGACGAASASLSFNSNLAAGWNPPGNNGQINGAFVIENSLGGAPIELGLRAQQRRVGPVTPDPANSYFYTVQPGLDPGTNNRAWWNFDWSASYGSSPTGGTTLGSLDSLRLNIYDQGNLLVSYDLLALIGGAINPTTINTAQDSWNPMFATIGVPGFDPNDQSFAYWFTLVASDNGHTAGTLMCVHTADTSCGVPPPIPEPGTLAVVSLGLGLLAARRRKRIG